MTTPPGWYPDPDHQGHGPAPERWWDGAGWTEGRRNAPSVHDAQTMLSAPSAYAPAPPPPGTAPYGPPHGPAPYGPPPGQPPGYPGGPPPAGPPTGRGRRGAVIAGVAAVVVAAVVAGVIALQGGDDGGDKGDEAGPSPSLGAPAPSEGTGGSGDDGDGASGSPKAPGGDSRVAVDPANGIAVPILDQWTASPPHADGLGITTSPYPCPGDGASRCVRGGVFTFGAAGKGYRSQTPEGIAREDIARNAEESYGAGQNDGKPAAYGGLDGHQELKAEEVTVAGQRGYLVRWKADTRKGDDGYVQTVVFPEPGQPAAEADLVVVRLGFDVSSAAPPLSSMDEIIRGIEPATGDGEGV
ncbi:DUF2510 domain-containing protein [Streptomyces buecherae]|uniref:DUF2510 domain-containing protein n=1 Tax=Streptomyces buecherae TaxID=2763006 RepID=A0A7H8NI32_9ACTN|nr:DUF2510 domain-containing protein [Streptomyces buecherae]QKW53178.1 DUF2510 domain-containing protein [Streptomyces buecherae]